MSLSHCNSLTLLLLLYSHRADLSCMLSMGAGVAGPRAYRYLAVLQWTTGLPAAGAFRPSDGT